MRAGFYNSWMCQRRVRDLRSGPAQFRLPVTGHESVRSVVLHPVSAQPVLQRAKGKIKLCFAHQDGQSHLHELYQAGCLKVMLPRSFGPITDGVVINTAGGLTGGDRLDVAVRLDAEARLRLATQTAERIYRAQAGDAQVDLRFELGAGAQLDWLAQETILFNGGAARRRIRADLESQASLFIVEPIVLGRAAMGEQVAHGLFHDSWQIRREGRLIFSDAQRLENFRSLGRAANWGDARAFASMVLIDPVAEDVAARLSSFDNSPEMSAIRFGLSSWNGICLVRLLGPDGMRLRAAIKAIGTEIRKRAFPRVWTM